MEAHLIIRRLPPRNDAVFTILHNLTLSSRSLTCCFVSRFFIITSSLISKDDIPVLHSRSANKLNLNRSNGPPQ
jgi:hypothetical protein